MTFWDGFGFLFNFPARRLQRTRILLLAFGDLDET